MLTVQASIDGPAKQLLNSLDNRARTKALRPAVQAVAKAHLDELKRLAPKTSGAFRRSLTVITRKPGRGNRSITCLVGQRKQRKNSNSVSKKTQSRGSQITRAGMSAPIHFLDRSTRAHTINPKRGRLIRFPGLKQSKAGGVRVTKTGRVTVTRGKNSTAAIFTNAVKHPGTQAQNILPRTAQKMRGRSTPIFASVVTRTIKLP